MSPHHFPLFSLLLLCTAAFSAPKSDKKNKDKEPSEKLSSKPVLPDFLRDRMPHDAQPETLSATITAARKEARTFLKELPLSPTQESLEAEAQVVFFPDLHPCDREKIGKELSAALKDTEFLVNRYKTIQEHPEKKEAFFSMRHHQELPTPLGQDAPELFTLIPDKTITQRHCKFSKEGLFIEGTFVLPTKEVGTRCICVFSDDIQAYCTKGIDIAQKRLADLQAVQQCLDQCYLFQKEKNLYQKDPDCIIPPNIHSILFSVLGNTEEKSSNAFKDLVEDRLLTYKMNNVFTDTTVELLCLGFPNLLWESIVCLAQAATLRDIQHKEPALSYEEKQTLFTHYLNVTAQHHPGILVPQEHLRRPSSKRTTPSKE